MVGVVLETWSRLGLWSGIRVRDSLTVDHEPAESEPATLTVDPYTVLPHAHLSLLLGEDLPDDALELGVGHTLALSGPLALRA